MKLGGTYEINAPRDKVFAAITDPNVLQRCIEGCEKMVKTSENSYDAHIKGNYVGKVQLQDVKPPESYTLVMEGKGAPGFVKGTARISLTDKGDKTELRYEADAQVGGMIAAIGSRLIEAIAKKMADDFFKKFAQQVHG
jgi:carbon monoxide dehydrogenase subunit G